MSGTMKRLLEEGKRMIRINSETSRGNEELANYTLALLQESHRVG